MKTISRNRLAGVFSLTFIILVAGSTSGAQKENLQDKAFKTMQSGNITAALEIYENAVAAEPVSRDIWLDYAQCLRRAKKMQAAARAGWHCLELGEETPAGWANIGNTFLECNAWQQAFEAYINAAKLCPDDKWNVQNFLNLGYTCLQRGELSMAARAVNCALSIDMESRLALIDYALLLGASGKTGEAKQELEKALALPEKSGDAEDKNTIAFGRNILETLEKEGRIEFPFPGNISFQNLPARFLTRPSKGSALKLAVDEQVTRFYTLADGFIMSMRTPEAWIESFELKHEFIFTIRLDVPGKLPSTLLVTPLPPSKKPYTAESLEKDVRKMGEILMKHATDTELVVYPIGKEEKNFGSSFTITDKNWKKGRPGDYPHVTQGIIVNGEHSCTFTLLSHSRDNEFIGSYLGIVQNILYRKVAD